MTSIMFVGCFLFLALLSPFASADYNAVVVQYMPLFVNASDDSHTIAVHLDAYVQYANNAPSDTDIIVFPEYTLGGIYKLRAAQDGAQAGRDGMFPYCEQIPVTGDNVNPCDDPAGDWGPHATTLSCAAKANNVILVANWCDYVPCNKDTDAGCPADGRYLYNTHVMFENDGTVLAKHHKAHLFGNEALIFDAANHPIVGIAVKTNINVTFGMLLSFDINFAEPVHQMLEQGVTDFVFSTWWVNTPPLGSATMIQQAFARQTQINLLAANAAACPDSCGSGIYSKGDVLATSFTSNVDYSSSTLSATLPTLTPVTVVTPDHPFTLNTLESPEAEECYGPYPIKGRCVQFTPEAGVETTMSVNDGTLHCELTQQAIASLANVTENWVLFAYKNNIAYPQGDSLPTETCVVMRCEPHYGNKWLKEVGPGVGVGALGCNATMYNEAIFENIVLSGDFQPTAAVIVQTSYDDSQLFDHPMLTHFTGSLVDGTSEVSTIAPMTEALFNLQLTHYDYREGHVIPDDVPDVVGAANVAGVNSAILMVVVALAMCLLN